LLTDQTASSEARRRATAARVSSLWSMVLRGLPRGGGALRPDRARLNGIRETIDELSEALGDDKRLRSNFHSPKLALRDVLVSQSATDAELEAGFGEGN
jgi:hypothetical protein